METFVIRFKVDQMEALRKRARLTQEELAAAGKMTARTYQRILAETKKGGTPPNVTLEKVNGICRAIKCKFTAILEHLPDP